MKIPSSLTKRLPMQFPRNIESSLWAVYDAAMLEAKETYPGADDRQLQEIRMAVRQDLGLVYD